MLKRYQNKITFACVCVEKISTKLHWDMFATKISTKSHLHVFLWLQNLKKIAFTFVCVNKNVKIIVFACVCVKKISTKSHLHLFLLVKILKKIAFIHVCVCENVKKIAFAVDFHMFLRTNVKRF